MAKAQCDVYATKIDALARDFLYYSSTIIEGFHYNSGRRTSIYNSFEIVNLINNTAEFISFGYLIYRNNILTSVPKVIN